MKILAFSDLHRDADAARRIVAEARHADVMVAAGDFATCRVGAGEILDILADAGVPMVMVSGNHDDPDELRALSAEIPGLHYLHGDGVSIGGQDFFGLGGEIPRRNPASWNFAVSEEGAAKALIACPVGAVLVTHIPPLGHADQQRDGRHDGSQAVTDAIVMQKPVLNVCGHIHSAWGDTSRIGPTQIKNLGPTANWFNV